MTVIGGYTLIQYPNENRIVVTLPQTMETIRNTITPIKDRRREITQAEETALLVCVKALFENCGSDMREVEDE